MNATDVLKHEHQVILMVLGATEREAQRIQAGRPVDAVTVGKMLDFYREFADRCHHAKEEKLLFVKMAERGMPVEGGPIAAMLHEHTLGRGFLRATGEALPLAGTGDAAAAAAVGENLAGYVRLLQAHIRKEDAILFPMADRLFSDEDQRLLSEAFDRTEAEEIGAGVHETYHQLAHELAEG